MLIIKNLEAIVDGKRLIQRLNLSIREGECHAIMGPNGAGKSSLARILAGDPSYEIIEGEIWFCGQNLLELSPEERVHLGVFMSFQYPLEIAGVSNQELLYSSHTAIYKARGKTPLSSLEFEKLLLEKMEKMGIKKEFKERGVNVGFSGGEKKKNEILQMAILEPRFAVLDETDSGLDIDAMKVVAEGMNNFKSKSNALLLITHYQRLLDYVTPDYVHVMIDGTLVQTGGVELVQKLETEGYANV